MINLILKGMDIYLAKDFSEKVTKPLANKLCVREDEINIISYESMIYHKGIDQTSMHLFIDVECFENMKEHEQDIAEVLFDVSKEFSIHTHIMFKYLDIKHFYEKIDAQYPMYLESQNIAEVNLSESETTQEVYDGNIFQDYEHLFPIDDKKKN